MRKTSDILWQDTQHQVLFEILDLIRDPEADERVIEHLRDYTENHFSLEERYMRELSYPGLDAHLSAHNRFRAEIAEILSAGQFDAQFREIIGTFLTEWLTRHVFGIDKELESFLLEADVR
ncbi:MAG: hemerythrin domain-containing protein [Halioglobus sp.]